MPKISKRYILSVLLLTEWLIGHLAVAAPTCASLFTNTSIEAANLKNKSTGVVQDKAKYFKDIAWLLKAVLPEIRQELSKINNNLGSDIEITQTKSFLNKVVDFELSYLNGIKPVENTVIYGSTNVPLYTLVTQVFLSASFSKNVWFRTPAATRDVYIKIFQLFKDYLPKSYTQNIHLITDPSDLAYDQFNRIYVMGQNRSGTKSIRPPSELVILTGSPETARTMIDRNIRHLKKLSKDYPNHKQLFLGFLAGVNPAVVVPSAKENMAKVVEKITFPFLVNGGQDCMNSDIIFVHQNVSAQFSAALMKKMNSLKLTTNLDREQGLTPVTMTKSFDKLLSYKEKYKKYLITPDATINVETKQVSPHIFVIPYNEFAALDIQEHFAPFVTIVKYDSSEQLKNASLDARIQRKAMAALIYGAEKMTSDMNEARNIFRQAQHFVLLNTHLYEEFEMNMPFGGIGTDTSISTLVKLKENGDVQVENRNRALLISKEAESAFSADGAYQTTISHEIQDLPKNYYSQAQRQEDTSIASLLKAGQKGVTILEDRPMNSDTAELYGVKFAYKSSDQAKKIKGVVLHLSEVGDEPSNKTSLLGDRNPFLNEEKVLKLVQQNKAEELKVAQAIDPSVMPGVASYNQFFTSKELKTINSAREKLFDLFKQLKHPISEKQKLTFENRLYVFVKDYLDLIQKKSPRGAYVKNYGEYASGDLGSPVTSFSASPKQITQEFLLWYYQAIQTHPGKIFDSRIIQDYLSQRSFSNFTRFVRQLLVEPSVLLIQQNIELAQTQQGATMEFRVDFMNGKAISSRMRFGLEHYPDEMKKAMAVVDDFFAKAPKEIQALSGGADVALTLDGRWIMFEFNFGGTSGTLYAEYYPFESNQIFSYLLGRPTPLLNKLSELSKLSAHEQNEFIKKQKHEKPVWWKFAISEISQLEWAKVLRDEYLKKWSQSANKASEVEELKNNLHELIFELGSHGNMDFKRLLETADDYIQRELDKNNN